MLALSVTAFVNDNHIDPFLPSQARILSRAGAFEALRCAVVLCLLTLASFGGEWTRKRHGSPSPEGV